MLCLYNKMEGIMIDNSSGRDLYARLSSAISNADNTRNIAKSYLDAYPLTQFWTWIQMEVGSMPAWAENHIKATKELEQILREYQKEGKKIPENLVKTLQTSHEVVGSISEKVDNLAFLQLMKRETPTVPGSSGLLSGPQKTKEIPKFSTEWQMNLGLMLNAYDLAKTEELKKEIGFLILNYLAKAAPVDLDRIANILPREQLKGLKDFKNLFQLGYFTTHGYHREINTISNSFSAELAPTFADVAKITSSKMYMLDTINIDQFFPLFYQPVALSEETSVDQMNEIFKQHYQNSTKNPPEQLEKPILFDLTEELGQFAITEKDPEKEKIFDEKFDAAQVKIITMVNSTIAEIKKSSPTLLPNKEDEDKMANFIKKNIIVVCRVPIKNFGAILQLPFDPTSRVTLISFMNLTGAKMGAVSSLKNINEFLSLKDLIELSDFQKAEYSVPGSLETIYFPNVKSITNMNLFKSFETKMKDLSDQQPMTAILGSSAIRLIRGMLEEISDEKWKVLNRDPVDLEGNERNDLLAKRALLQSTLFRLTQHLATADSNSDDFTEFSGAIELILSEIATLLQLIAPMKVNEFEDIYKQQLDFVPENLQKHVTAGVTKSAMNTFSGICNIVKSANPAAQIVNGENSYFEELYVVGANRSIDEVLKNAPETKVDLYVGEFNHNINTSKDYHHYTPIDVISDIERLLKGNKQLTIALDSTIDLLNSPKAKELLTKFSKEIESGDLNIIFFRSGQKFEMLGMDNYYGSPYYMVNNGGPQWDAFNGLKTQDAFKTDPLSMQWFCLANKYAPQQLDDYRALIFKNSREILNKIPEELKDPASPVIVSTVDNNMEPAFIDIKIVDRYKMNRERIETLFYDKMMGEGRKAHSRGSFGFYHPNLNSIIDEEHITIRINPGLDPKDNDIIVEVLKDIVKDLQRK